MKRLYEVTVTYYCLAENEVSGGCAPALHGIPSVLRKEEGERER